MVITNDFLANFANIRANTGPANANIRRDLQITNAIANTSKSYGFVFVPTPNFITDPRYARVLHLNAISHLNAIAYTHILQAILHTNLSTKYQRFRRV